MPILPCQIVLTFHGLGPAPDGTADDERPYWVPVETFECILDRLPALERARGLSISVTLDDGFASDHAIAYPRLVAARRRAFMFPVVGEIGAPGRVTESNLVEMRHAGITIGSHGLTHTRLTTLPDRELHEELTLSRARLSDLLGSDVTTVSLPYGACDRRTLALAREAGYTTVFTSHGGACSGLVGVVPRTTVRADFDPIGDLDRLAALPSRARSASVGRLKRWLLAG